MAGRRAAHALSRRSLAWADARQIDSEPSDEMLMSIGRGALNKLRKCSIL